MKHKPVTPDPEVIQVAADSVCVSCDGGAMGHPRVWYTFEGRHKITCGYCDRVFVKKGA